MKRIFLIFFSTAVFFVSPSLANQQVLTVDVLDDASIDETEQNVFKQDVGRVIQEIVDIIMKYVGPFADRPTTELISEDEICLLLGHRNGEVNPRRERILSQVAKIVSGILNIARDPHNAHNVGDSVGNMVHGIINVTIDVVQSKQDKKALDEQLDEITREINDQVAAMDQ